MLEFIVVSAAEGANAPTIGLADRRLIRQQAMRHVRRYRHENAKELEQHAVSQSTRTFKDASARRARVRSHPGDLKHRQGPRLETETACARTPMSMGSSVEREQIIGRLFEFLCPETMVGREKVHRKLLGYFERDASAMRAATNASLLRSLSVAKNDPDLSELSRRHHAASVRLVKDAVHSSDQTLSLDIVWAVDALFIHSVVPGTAATAEHGLWRQHTRGFGALIESYGMKRLTSTPEGLYTLSLVLDHLPNLLMEAIISRRALFLGEARWTHLLLSQGPVYLTRLVILACRIPALLAGMDALVQVPEPTRDYDRHESTRSQTTAKDVYHDLFKLELGFQQWLWDWYDLLPPDHQASYQLPLHRIQTSFPDFIYEQYDLHEPVTCFPSLMSAVTHVYYWTLLLIVRKALYEVSTAHPEMHIGNEIFVESLLHAADESANDIVFAAPYLVALLWNSPANNSIICGPLTWADGWFLATGDTEASARCRRITDAFTGQRSAAEAVCLPRSMAAWLGTAR